jgi:hypothetical protein
MSSFYDYPVQKLKVGYDKKAYTKDGEKISLGFKTETGTFQGVKELLDDGFFWQQ